MTDTILFIYGAFVSLLIVASIAMLLWAAREDGKKQAAESKELGED
jgi:cbb3-type cytochrome oxidase subunit 3